MSIINAFTSFMVERFNSIQAVIIFGSYARSEESNSLDFDAFLIFDQLNPSVLLEVGQASRDFFARYQKNVSYPMCLTMEDFHRRNFKKVFADPIKYFEAIVTYGNLPIDKPSKERVTEFCNDVLSEASIALRSQI